MKNKKDHKHLFQELEQWSQRKDVFSVDDFLKEKGVAYSDFELFANSSKKLMKIWGAAEGRVWENLKDALFKRAYQEVE